jgi:hypothetical protein
MPRMIAAAAALMAKRVVPDQPAMIVTHHATSAVVEALGDERPSMAVLLPQDRV